jgi:hypothetical protein
MKDSCEVDFDPRGRANMATLVIRDLEENSELDRKAMRTIVGGRRARLHGEPIRRSLYLRPRPLFR